jgi:23S rRNA (uracil-5-)-methyltransferase RumA
VPSLSTERVHCDHADRCGGCPILHLSYDEQLAFKGHRVSHALARYPSLKHAAPEPVCPARPIVGYRTRAKLVVGPDGSIGLFAKGGGHRVVDIPRCRVLSPPLARVAEALRGLLRADATQFGARSGSAGADGAAFRAVDLRETNDGGTNSASRVLVTFVIDRSRGTDPALLQDLARVLMRKAPEVIGVAVNFHEGVVPQILGGETRTLAGVASALDRVGSSMHFATFGSFVQAHRGQAERAHAMLAEAIGLSSQAGSRPQRARVLDLYGGSGAIALGLARAGAKVTLVESFAPAVAQANAAARSQGLDVDTVCADVAGALRSLRERRERFDAAILNPPRRGTSVAARQELARLEPGVLVYASCDPDTLARDLAHLARLGYETTSIRPLDMIPLTEEVETVAVLRRAPVPPPDVVYEDAEAIVVDKSAHEPTSPQGEYSDSLSARVRRLVGAEQASPVHRMDVGTSGVALFARRLDGVAKWRRAFESPTTRKSYITVARGITPSKGVVEKSLRDNGDLASARTRYRRLAILAGHSVLRVTTREERAHQVRRHLASIGHPVLGDERYGHAPTNRHFEEKTGLDRTFLHCVQLDIDHPDARTSLAFETRLAGELLAVLERMGGRGAIHLLDGKDSPPGGSGGPRNLGARRA